MVYLRQGTSLARSLAPKPFQGLGAVFEAQAPADCKVRWGFLFCPNRDSCSCKASRAEWGPPL